MRTPARPGGGGVPARRALVRWAVRMVRREWRQQILVLTLMTVAVAAAIGLAAAAYNVAPVSGNAQFGSANHFLTVEKADEGRGPATIEAASRWFGTIDVIGHRKVAVPGRFEPLDHRSQDPDGAYSAPLLSLRAGRYPVDGAEVAVTDGVAEEMTLDMGADLSADGTPRTVVGMVENPSDLSDEFALMAPADDAVQESITILVHADTQLVRSFRPPGDGTGSVGSRGRSTKVHSRPRRCWRWR